MQGISPTIVPSAALDRLPSELMGEIARYLTLEDVLHLFATMSPRLRHLLTVRGVYPTPTIFTNVCYPKWALKDWFKSVQGDIEEVFIATDFSGCVSRQLKERERLHYDYIKNGIAQCKSIKRIKMASPLRMETLPEMHIATEKHVRGPLKLPNYKTLFPDLTSLTILHRLPMDRRDMPPERAQRICALLFENLPRNLEFFEWSHHEQEFHAQDHWKLLPRTLTSMKLQGQHTNLQLLSEKDIFAFGSRLADFPPRLAALALQLSPSCLGYATANMPEIAPNALQVWPDSLVKLKLQVNMKQPFRCQWPASLGSLSIAAPVGVRLVDGSPELDIWKENLSRLPDTLTKLSMRIVPWNNTSYFFDVLPKSLTKLHIDELYTTEATVHATHHFPELAFYHEMATNSLAADHRPLASLCFAPSLTDLSLTVTVISRDNAPTLPTRLKHLTARFVDSDAIAATHLRCPECAITAISKFVTFVGDRIVDDDATSVDRHSVGKYLKRTFGSNTDAVLMSSTGMTNQRLEPLIFPSGIEKVNWTPHTMDLCYSTLKISSTILHNFDPLRSLTWLSITLCPAVGDVSNEMLAKLPQGLTYLDLQYTRFRNPLKSSSFPKLALKTLRFKTTLFQTNVQWTDISPHLETLDTPNMVMATKTLSSKLPPSVTFLSVNVIGPVDDTSVRTIIKHYSNLKKFCLGPRGYINITGALVPGGTLELSPSDFVRRTHDQLTAPAIGGFNKSKKFGTSSSAPLVLPSATAPIELLAPKWILSTASLSLPSSLTALDLLPSPNLTFTAQGYLPTSLNLPASLTSLKAKLERINRKYPANLTSLAVLWVNDDGPVLWEALPPTLRHLSLEVTGITTQQQQQQPLQQQPNSGKIPTILPSAPILQTLHIPQFDFERPTPTSVSSTSATMSLQQKYPSLTDLKFLGGADWKDFDISALIEAIPTLTQLSTRSPVTLTGELLQADSSLSMLSWQVYYERSLAALSPVAATCKLALAVPGSEILLKIPSSVTSVDLCSGDEFTPPIEGVDFADLKIHFDCLPESVTSLEWRSMSTLDWKCVYDRLSPDLQYLTIHSKLILNEGWESGLPRNLVHLCFFNASMVYISASAEEHAIATTLSPCERSRLRRPYKLLNLPDTLTELNVPTLDIAPCSKLPPKLSSIVVAKPWWTTEMPITIDLTDN